MEAGSAALTDAQKVQAIDRYFAANYNEAAGQYEPIGKDILQASKETGLRLNRACALVEQESWGRNVFGCDHGPRTSAPWCRQRVTKERVAQLRRHPLANGVGTTQLTVDEFVGRADALGGAHLPINQMRVGFSILLDYLNRYPALEAWGAYNAGASGRHSVVATYGRSCNRLDHLWGKRLGYRPKRGARREASGWYAQNYPMHFGFRSDVKELVDKYEDEFYGQAMLLTYYMHPPVYGRKWEFVSMDAWDPAGRGVALNPATGDALFTRIMEDYEGPLVQWIIWRGRMWSRGGGWEVYDPPEDGSDPGHHRHIHCTYAL